MALLPHYRPVMVSSELVKVQPMSPPDGTALLAYMDVKYESKMEKKSRRKSTMRRFKIKYTNTKGVVKTRNIKATSEERAMSEIKDMGQHHYTIVESLDEPDPVNPCKEVKLDLSKFTRPGIYSRENDQNLGRLERLEKWSTVITGLAGSGKSNLSAEKIGWLSEYAANHAQWESSSNSIYTPYLDTWDDSSHAAMKIADNSSYGIFTELPIARRVFSSLTPQSAIDVSPLNAEKKN